MKEDSASAVVVDFARWVGARRPADNLLEDDERRVDEELRRRTDRAGADSAYAAADAAVLPSLADFLR